MLPILFVAAFLLGSIPTGFIIAKIYGIDIRTQGSGNTGATNVGRTLGKKAGVLTLLLDACKGILPTLTAPMFVPLGAHGFGVEAVASILGLFAIFGHCFSPFLGFKGGKGVATSLGVFLVIAPVPTLLSMVIFLICVKVFGYVSVGSMVASISVPISIAFSFPRPYSAAVLYVSIIVALLIVVRHKKNIANLFQGNENHWKKK